MRAYFWPFLILVLLSCSANRSIRKVRSDCAKWEKYSSSIRRDNSIYFGEGIGTIIDNRTGDAKIEAYDNALLELAKSIKVRVRGDIKSRTVSTMKFKNKREEEEVREEIEKLVETYTDQILVNPKQSDLYLNCPFEDNLVLYLSVTKRDYNKIVAEDLDAKKSLVTSYADEGFNAFNEYDYLSAIKSWINARYYLNESFGKLPVLAVVGSEKRTVELNSHIDNQLDSFFGRLSIKLLNQDFQYDASGQINRNPTLYVHYVDKENNEKPVFGMPLKATITSGQGQISEALTTSLPQGQAELSIYRIDPTKRSASILVEIDKEADALQGLELFQSVHANTLLIIIEKKRTVAVLVTMSGSDDTRLKQRIHKDIISSLSEIELDVRSIESTSTSDKPNDVEFEQAKVTNADYVLHLFMTVQTSTGPIENLIKANCAASLTAYVVENKTEFNKINIGEEEGLGATSYNAISHAYSKLKESIKEGLDTMVERFR